MIIPAIFAGVSVSPMIIHAKMAVKTGMTLQNTLLRATPSTRTPFEKKIKAMTEAKIANITTEKTALGKMGNSPKRWKSVTKNVGRKYAKPIKF